MRDLMSKPKTVAHSAGDGGVLKPGSGPIQVDNEKRRILSFVNDGACSAILDISFQRVLKREKVLPGMALSLGSLELWSDDIEGKGDFGQYRSRLVWKSFIFVFKIFWPVIADMDWQGSFVDLSCNFNLDKFTSINNIY